MQRRDGAQPLREDCYVPPDCDDTKAQDLLLSSQVCRPDTRTKTMRVPRGPLFQPLDIALMVGFAMAFILLTTLRLA